MGKVVERIVNAERVEDLITVFGSFDENIKRIEEALNVRVVNRGTDLRVSGDEEMADKAVRTLEGLLSLAAKGETIDEQRVRYLITLVNEGNDAQVAQMAKDVVCITAKGKPIKAKTVGQQNYMKAIMKNTITPAARQWFRPWRPGTAALPACARLCPPFLHRRTPSNPCSG